MLPFLTVTEIVQPTCCSVRFIYCSGTSCNRKATTRGNYRFRRNKTKGSRSGRLYLHTAREFSRLWRCWRVSLRCRRAQNENHGNLKQVSNLINMLRLFCIVLGELKVGGLSITERNDENDGPFTCSFNNDWFLKQARGSVQFEWTRF
jgi:hypothetical protein